MDAERALADLTEISAQVEAAVVLDAQGAIAAASPARDARAERVARAVREAFAAADAVRPEATQLEAATRAGTLLAVRDGDRVVAATTPRSAPAGLVLYDLRACLRALAGAAS